MFTGIIEVTSEVLGSVEDGDLLTLTLERPVGWELTVGQSIAVSGVCLTVESFTETDFVVTLMAETLKRSTYGLGIPKKVNLERAMPANGRFEGHIVQGHVDDRGEVTAISDTGKWRTYTISYNQEHSKLVVPKGSVAIEGVSLTVVDPTPGELQVALIPHTLEVTTLGSLKVGSPVNLEFDILGKYLLQK